MENKKYLEPLEGELYKDYIQRILDSRENKRIDGEYMERHHILPKCKGGTWKKDNIIYLFAQEHYYAHKLLAEENPKDYQLVWAWQRTSYVDGVFITADESAKLKELKSNIEMPEEVRIKISQRITVRYGLENNNSKPVWCKENNRVYFSAREAGEVFGLGYKLICRNANSELNPIDHVYRGLHFRPATQEEIDLEIELRGEDGDPLYPTDEILELIKNFKFEKPPRTKEQLEQQSKRMKKYYESHPEVKEQFKEAWSGDKNPRAHAVYLIDLNKTFLTMDEGCKFSGAHNANILKCIKGERNKAGGYHWRYATESEIEEEKLRRLKEKE